MSKVLTGNVVHRGFHPHLDHPELLQHITFRLFDSVPANAITSWRGELARMQGTDGDAVSALQARIDRYEDAGHGVCWLGQPLIAAVAAEAFAYFDGERYELLEWCVMPNHVHVLIQTKRGLPMGSLVRSWKGHIAKTANRILGRDKGLPFWAPDYFDRFMRDDAQLLATRRYIQQNPVKAGLASSAEHWPWGSAARGREGRGPTE